MSYRSDSVRQHIATPRRIAPSQQSVARELSAVKLSAIKLGYGEPSIRNSEPLMISCVNQVPAIRFV